MPRPAVNRPIGSCIPGAAYRGILAACLVGWLLLTGCQPGPLPPSPTATPPAPALVTGVTETNLADLIMAEREAAISGDLLRLAALWAEDARIVDGRGTAPTADDYIWQGRSAILDRYVLAVFPAPPPPADAAALQAAPVQVERRSEREAVATLVNGGDRWRLVQRDGRWWLHELVYSAP